VEEYGFRSGESTIRREVAILQEKTREVFIPLTAAWNPSLTPTGKPSSGWRRFLKRIAKTTCDPP